MNKSSGTKKTPPPIPIIATMKPISKPMRNVAKSSTFVSPIRLSSLSRDRLVEYYVKKGSMIKNFYST